MIAELFTFGLSPLHTLAPVPICCILEQSMLLRYLGASVRSAWRSKYSSNRTSAARVLGAWTPPGRLQRWGEDGGRLFTSSITRRQEVSSQHQTDISYDDVLLDNTKAADRAKALPVTCPGCGALSQTIDPEAAGFYGSRKLVRTQRKPQRMTNRDQKENEIFRDVVASGAVEIQGEQPEPLPTAPTQSPSLPICDRCHYLRYQSRGTGIIHPSMQSIQEIIEESPHKHNHIYHVIDAADFPMSVIPNLVMALDLPRLRTQNRRSKSMHYIRGRQAEVSFIITRSDLLAPKKEQVDTLLPYLREVLRDTLGRSGRNVRLGNVRCVSAQRGWWTKTVKEDIWSRGGAGWMIGKVNVGKSALYEVVFPKGRQQEDVDVAKIRQREEQALLQTAIGDTNEEDATSNANLHQRVPVRVDSFADSPGELSEGSMKVEANSPDAFQESLLETEGFDQDIDNDDLLPDEQSLGTLLPPAQPETAYPSMPLVSALPGTTASPIRIPFGNGKGELIDLPGIERSTLDTHVRPEFRKHLIMKSRVVPEQYTIKPGQSLLIGGLIRITPKNEDLVFLAYPFVPLDAHVTSNDKAIAIQTGISPEGEAYPGTVSTIATDTAKQHIKQAATFKLDHDVTKARTGSLTDRSAGKQRVANLPFIVYSADILIESVGWIELTCQVRSRQKSFIVETVRDAFGEDTFRKQGPLIPEVEVWSPEGKFVAVRRPMNAWVLGGPKKVAKHLQRQRPRHSISFHKRREGGAKGGRAVALEEG